MILTLDHYRKRTYPTIKAFAEFYGVSPGVASDILHGKHQHVLSKVDVEKLADALGIRFDECIEACEASYRELRHKNKQGPMLESDFLKTRWRREDELTEAARKAKTNRDWTEFHTKYTNDTFSRSGSRSGEHTWSSGSDNARWSHAGAAWSVHETCFTILGIPSTATPEQIKQAFREKIRAMHPDSGGAGGNADALTQAKEQALRYAEGVKA